MCPAGRLRILFVYGVHTHIHTHHTVTQHSFLIMCLLKAISLKGGVHMCFSARACERRCQLCFGGLFHMCDGGFYVTVGLTRTYHLFITLDQINSVSCHLLPNTVVCPFAWTVGGVSGVQRSWIKSNCWNMMNNDRLRGFNLNLFIQFTLTWVKWHMCVSSTPCIWITSMCYAIYWGMHVKHQNKPFATFSFSVYVILVLLIHIILKQNTVLCRFYLHSGS